MTSSACNIHHVGIVVQDVETSANWYTEKLGFERLFFRLARRAGCLHRTWRSETRIISERSVVTNGSRSSNSANNLRIGGINHFALEVRDIDAALEDLKARGVDIVSPVREVSNSGGHRFAFIHDNEQMLIEIFRCVNTDISE